MKNSKTQQGFSLIETIVAIFIISVGIITVLSINYRNIGFSSDVSDKLTAIYLAQEGIEIVKNIRDTNLLTAHKEPTSGVEWDDGLTLGSDIYNFDYRSTSIPDNSNCSGTTHIAFDSWSGFYRCDTSGKFERKVNIVSNVDHLEVLVTVSWSKGGSSRSVTAQENLYEWGY